jgi:hypothetical protein
MDDRRFDALTRFFAGRRTRRQALVAAGASVGALRLASASAQDATPAASPVASAPRTQLLFVQTFGPGSLTPVDGTTDQLVLTADHLAGQTLYFSDRPARVVGMMSTERFFGESESGGLGFTPANPPNAALVVAGEGDAPTQIVVLELTDPSYDAANGQVRYTVRVLEEIEQLDLSLEELPLSAAEAALEFTAASLFIDDMPGPDPGLGKYDFQCLLSDNVTVVSDILIEYCVTGDTNCVAPCTSDDLTYWTDYCNQNYRAACNGTCNPAFLYPLPGLCSNLYVG